MYGMVPAGQARWLLFFVMEMEEKADISKDSQAEIDRATVL
jgi:hypothetical protein